uniref:AT-rich interactive domain-containing protein 5B-like isoform X2 n=1 Tax=Pristiophorus japonicus TaxID=55135 RepID=UPI00398F4F48
MAPSLTGRSRRTNTQPAGGEQRDPADTDAANADVPQPEMQCELNEAPAVLATDSGMAGTIPAGKDLTISSMGQQFLTELHQFMKERGTPIERIPHLGFKQVNLSTLYKAVEKLGGYEAVTTSRLWKNIYDELGGNPGSTSAATCTRRHYERLVLPYERHIKGEEDKPLPAYKPRKQYNVIKHKEAKRSCAEQKEKYSKRKWVKDSEQRSGDTNRVFPHVDSEDAGGEKTEDVSVDSEPPSPGNTTAGSEDSKDQPLYEPVLPDNSGNRSPLRDAARPGERPTQSEASEDQWDTRGPSPDGVSGTTIGRDPVGGNGHRTNAVGTECVSEETGGGRTATCEDDGTDSRRPRASATSEDNHPTRASPEAGKGPQPSPRFARQQEIMSPLAKKKFLAQGSDRTSPGFNAVGSPASPAGVKGSEIGTMPPVSTSSPEASIHRPSVIRHIQHPRQSHPEYRSEWPFPSAVAKYQLYPSKPSLVPSANGHGAQEEQDPKGRAAEHCQPPRCFGNFSCSPYVHGIVKPLLHYPNKSGAFGCYANPRSFRVFGGSVPALLSEAQKPERRYGRLDANDQPTDLSLPRASSPPTQPPWVIESKSSPSPLRWSSFTSRASSSFEGHPKACWVPPISVALPRRVPAKRPKSEGPPSNAKSGPPTCRPAQRSQTELDTTYGKKLRIVSPLLVAKDTEAKDGQGGGDRKAMGGDPKHPVPGGPGWPLMPQDSAYFEAVRSRLPAGYAHHLDHVKSQALYSPFIPSLTLNSFMIPAIQGPAFGSPSYPLDLYKHLAVGTSYENLLRHRLYPFTAWYPSPHLPPAHSAHKL